MYKTTIIEKLETLNITASTLHGKTEIEFRVT